MLHSVVFNSWAPCKLIQKTFGFPAALSMNGNFQTPKTALFKNALQTEVTKVPVHTYSNRKKCVFKFTKSSVDRALFIVKYSEF